jgi:hypothetical protein
MLDKANYLRQVHITHAALPLFMFHLADEFIAYRIICDLGRRDVRPNHHLTA